MRTCTALLTASVIFLSPVMTAWAGEDSGVDPYDCWDGTLQQFVC